MHQCNSPKRRISTYLAIVSSLPTIRACHYPTLSVMILSMNLVFLRSPWLLRGNRRQDPFIGGVLPLLAITSGVNNPTIS